MKNNIITMALVAFAVTFIVARLFPAQKGTYNNPKVAAAYNNPQATGSLESYYQTPGI